jgi:hypothetical protein
MPVPRQLGGEVVLGRGEAKLLEAPAFAHDERLPVDIGERRSDPQVERVAQRPADRVGGRTLRPSETGAGHRPLEAEDIHRVVVDHQLVAARARPQPVGVVNLPEDHPQARDMETERLDGRIGLLVAPEPVEEDVVGQQPLRMQGQEREQRTLLGGTDRHRAARRVQLHRPQETDFHGALPPVCPGSRGCYALLNVDGLDSARCAQRALTCRSPPDVRIGPWQTSTVLPER